MVNLNPVPAVQAWAGGIKHAFSSKQAWNEFIHTEGNADGKHSWTNEDLRPSSLAQTNWHWWNFCLFWLGMGFGNWTLGSSIVGAGLTWYEAMFVVIIASLVAGLCMAFNSRAASNYHVGYPVLLRTCFGMYGHYWPVLARGCCALLWVSVLNFEGGAYVSTMINCIVGNSWNNLPVQFPASVGTTVQRFIGFLIFWAIELPFCSLRPYQLKWLYTFKAWTLGPGVIGLLIYCLVQSNGKLASDAALAGVTLAKGGTLGWLFVSNVNSAMGNWSTFIANMPDFSRYATSPKATMWTHILFVPIPAALGGIIGIFGTSALQKAWGVTLWNQWDVMDAILEHQWTGGMRLFVFLESFIAALFLFGSILGANLLPFASDVTALFPTYFNLTRGMWFCCIISLALMPWKILASANGFLAFLGGYGIFMGPTAAIMMVDYWIVRRGNIRIWDAYTSNPGSTYMYFHGFNLNAVIAYFSGMIIPFVGFIGTFGVSVPDGATRLDDLGWYISSIVAGLMYVILCKIFPLKNIDPDMPWEKLALEFKEEREREDVEDTLEANVDESISDAAAEKVMEEEQEKGLATTVSVAEVRGTYHHSS
ncbi:hypothetical protein CALVIDRAFT_542160 [Calocera viscosa TUFC12733]|uniref:Allantoin permease n=1 Tax=Calocera viscosa (strain TUFC12733) TaxID=1330018 RepID=A0A167GX10_CALVF|nr:hypothetical protein CALVIDRAFT_542160 [Calocera viscosa TUFC12733]